MAASWAYQDNVAVEVVAGTYMTMLPNTIPLRLQFLGGSDDRHQLNVTLTSLAHPCNSGDCVSRPSWAVFTTMLRVPNVSGVVPLPADIAAMCSRFPTSWAASVLQEEVRRGFVCFLSGSPSTKDKDRIISVLRPELAI